MRDFNHVWSFGARVVRDEEREHHEIFGGEYFTAHGLRRDLDEHVRERGVDGKNEVDVGVRDFYSSCECHSFSCGRKCGARISERRTTTLSMGNSNSNT